MPTAEALPPVIIAWAGPDLLNCDGAIMFGCRAELVIGASGFHSQTTAHCIVAVPAYRAHNIRPGEPDYYTLPQDPFQVHPVGPTTDDVLSAYLPDITASHEVYLSQQGMRVI